MSKKPRSLVLVWLLLAAFAGLPWSGCKEDPCTNIICKNGGVCINGDCDCPAGYEGPDCGTEKLPENIRIAEITYTKMPLTRDDGNTWDISVGEQNPDLKAIIYRDADPDPSTENWVAIWDSEADLGLVENHSPTQQQVFNPTVPVLLSNPLNHYRVSLYDWDNDGDKLMGGITLNPYTAGEGFPAQLIFENADVRFVLNLTYDF